MNLTQQVMEMQKSLKTMQGSIISKNTEISQLQTMIGGERMKVLKGLIISVE